MNIQSFIYFVTIVECQCNLSLAAKQLHISQSALSKAILQFEQKENILLFIRKKGRLSELTQAGKIVYMASKDIISRYQQMTEEMHRVSSQYKGQLNLGITPFFLSIGFSGLLNTFILQHPDIQVNYFEAGALNLCDTFDAQELDFAFMALPPHIRPNDTNEYPIISADLCAFMSKTHPLAEKDILSWTDLHDIPIVLYNETFTIHKMVTDQLHTYNVQPSHILKTAHYDYMFEIISDTNYVTILPAPATKLCSGDIVTRTFEDPIKWETLLFERQATANSYANQCFLRHILSHLNQ